jgi:ADP-dependent NAD(P)H-hydrate dehydratase / NAD(P)H-hydrate epimerase
VSHASAALARGLLSTAGMRAADAAAVASGVASRDLMEAAGAAVARAVVARFAPCPVRVLCGPGNNGGDGFVAARHLVQAGWRDVRVALLGPVAALAGDAASAAGSWSGPVEPLDPGVVAGAGLVVDALFGTGLARPLPELVEQVLRASAPLPHVAVPRVAVDVPSGLTGDGGLQFAPWLAQLGPAAMTVTFHAAKPAHVLVESAALCGPVVVADIGIPGHRVPPDTVVLNTPALWRGALVWPGAASHKHSRGRLAVVAGPRHATGAARLAARAGARIGAGWTTLVATPQAADIIAGHEIALLLAVVRDEAGFDDVIARHGAVVFGPAAGTGAPQAQQLAQLLASDRPLVLDADALTLLAQDSALREALPARAGPTVLTPHDGEFARLFGPLLPPDILACRLTATRAGAQLTGATVVRKGAVTLVAEPGGQVRVNTHASPWLATAGTGDALAGMIGALLAQGLTAFDAAGAAVWMHGDAALRAGPGLMAQDLELHLPAVLTGLGASAGARGTEGQKP